MIAYILTLSRPLLAGMLAALVMWASGQGPLTGKMAVVLLALMAMEEFTDALDGYFARRQGTASLLGGVLDPYVDSISRLAIYLSFAYAGWIHVAVPLVMMLRDLTVAYTRVVNSVVGAKLGARRSGKLKAIVQGSAMPIIIILALAAERLGPAQLAAGRWVVAGAVLAVTIWSLVDYVVVAWPAVVAMARRRSS